MEWEWEGMHGIKFTQLEISLYVLLCELIPSHSHLFITMNKAMCEQNTTKTRYEEKTELCMYSRKRKKIEQILVYIKIKIRWTKHMLQRLSLKENQFCITCSFLLFTTEKMITNKHYQKEGWKKTVAKQKGLLQLQFQRYPHLITASNDPLAKSMTPEAGRVTRPTMPLPIPLKKPSTPSFLAPSMGFRKTPVTPSNTPFVAETCPIIDIIMHNLLYITSRPYGPNRVTKMCLKDTMFHSLW